MRLWYIVFLLFGFYGTPSVFGQELQPPVISQPSPVYVAPCVGCLPQVIYRPQIQLVPYLYQNSTVRQMEYPTPLRNLFFGRYRINHYYQPQVTR